MLQLEFAKLHAAGNDFLIIEDTPASQTLSPDMVAALCNRHTGVGSGALIRVCKTRSVLTERAGDTRFVQALSRYSDAELAQAEFFLDLYHTDGTARELCADALRVYAHYLLTNGMLKVVDRRETVAIATPLGIKDVLIGVTGYSVNLGRWQRSDNIAANVFPATELVFAGYRVGSVHQVAQVADYAQLQQLTAEQLQLEQFLDRCDSVVFAALLNPTAVDAVGQLAIRVFTPCGQELPACGSSAIAAALHARAVANDALLHHWRISCAGGLLGVRMFPTEEGEHAAVTGAAEFICSGQLTIPEPADT